MKSKRVQSNSIATRGQHYWQDQIAAWQRSNLSQVDFCQQGDLNLHTFKYWKSKLAKQSREKPAHSTQRVGRRKMRQETQVTSGFVKLTPAPKILEPITLHLGEGIQLSWHGELSPRYVKALLEVIKP